ncbi:MAG: site-2 protease family protein [Chloroflexi bacterium]|nr:site-2 protease family protein [Chloroflexota bacterium]
MDPIQNDLEKLSAREIYTQLVKEVLGIDQLVMGETQDDFVIQFEGLLKLPSEVAYAQLSQSLKPYKLVPLFRTNQSKHLIILKNEIPLVDPPKTSINILLFGITFLSILFAGILSSYTGPETGDLRIIWSHSKGNLGQAFAFAISMFSILTAHEFGHYFAARYHKTSVTLPFFIPFPLSSIGTMGAFIRLLEPPKNKKVLLDIGLAGPLAGLIITIPVLIIGLSISPVDQLPSVLPANFAFEGNSIFYLLLKYLVHGTWLPEPASYSGLSPLLYWIRYFFTGRPYPLGGSDVLIHPVAWAGWVGLLITSLNLLPAGQLDGGHLIYSLYGKQQKWIRPTILIVLFTLGFLWSGWWLWAFMILLLGNRYAEPLDQITELDPFRIILAKVGLVIFFLIFMPVPLVIS